MARGRPAGPLTLRRGNYPITGTHGAMLVVHYAVAGSDDAERLARLTR
ncbi:hypothetical protein LQ327_29985 [Actinomycetospora endophytica]|uniref:MmyB-like transcription regulator ligand binding domain-containing protein n=1 Tax=Actinomycetospora endophytica TaxID=2291215 RepID=A0ABS8PH69_9PSEU|nr:hypothetical protein [Actinomycetospora endophytica]MCD2197609.1 hypothetical protein [Actinomycetospora endophytica]